MSDPEAKKCSRPGCGKKLRSNNTRGVCSSGCLSDEAPSTCRAKGVSGASEPAATRAKPKKAKPAESPREAFSNVARGLGKDPEAIIDQFCEGWLDALRERLES